MKPPTKKELAVALRKAKATKPQWINCPLCDKPAFYGQICPEGFKNISLVHKRCLTGKLGMN